MTLQFSFLSFRVPLGGRLAGGDLLLLLLLSLFPFLFLLRLFYLGNSVMLSLVLYLPFPPIFFFISSHSGKGGREESCNLTFVPPPPLLLLLPFSFDNSDPTRNVGNIAESGWPREKRQFEFWQLWQKISMVFFSRPHTLKRE